MTTQAYRPAGGVTIGGFYIPDFAERFFDGLRAMAIEPIGDIADVSLTDNTSQYPILVDSAEDQDLSEYDGDPASGVNNTLSIDGSYAIHIDSGSSGHGIDSVAGNGLPKYPDQGEEFGCYIYISGNLGDREPAYGWAYNDTAGATQGDNNWLGVKAYYLWWRSGTLKLVRGDGGGSSRTELASTSTSYSPSNEWIDFRTKWATDGTMTCEVQDVNGNTVEGPISATDTTYTDGGIHLGVNQNTVSGRNWWDYYRIIGTV